MKSSKRILSTLLTFVLVLSMSLQAFAGVTNRVDTQVRYGEQDTNPDAYRGNGQAALSATPATWNIGKTTASAVTAKLTSDGTLTISGTGDVTTLTDANSWVSDTVLPTITKVVFSGTVSPKSMAGWFKNATTLASVDLSGLYADQCTDFTSTFEGCSALTSIDLRGFDTAAGATQMNNFLARTNSLATVKVNPSFVTSPSTTNLISKTTAGDITFNGVIDSTVNTWLTANAAAANVTVKYPSTKASLTANANGGEFAGGASSEVDIYNAGDQIVTPNDVTRTGYTFSLWAYNTDGTIPFSDEDVIASNTTVYAIWLGAGPDPDPDPDPDPPTPGTYTVTFDTNGGTPGNFTQTVTGGSKAYEPEAPTREHYTFDGWYKGASKYNFDTAVNSDFTLKASWKGDTCTIKLYAGDSSGGSKFEDGNYTKTITTTYGSKIQSFETPKATRKLSFGYWRTEKSSNWKTQETTSSSSSSGSNTNSDSSRVSLPYTVLESANLYAAYDEEDNTDTIKQVTFDYNGGKYQTKTSKVIEVQKGDKITEPDKPTYGKHKFKGWYTVKEDFTKDDKWDFDTYTVDDDLTLYARWSGVGSSSDEDDNDDKKDKDTAAADEKSSDSLSDALGGLAGLSLLSNLFDTVSGESKSKDAVSTNGIPATGVPYGGAPAVLSLIILLAMAVYFGKKLRSKYHGGKL